MKKIIIAIAIIGISISVYTGNDEKNINYVTSEHPPACKTKNAHLTGEQYNVIAEKEFIRAAPNINSNKIINQKTKSTSRGNDYISIDDSVLVFEECTKDDWSWVRVLHPDWLQNSHRGWVQTKSLDKGQYISDDPYARKIASYAMPPYDVVNYPKTTKKYKTRLAEIEKLRRKAAEMALDSGKCDFAEIVELSASKSSLSHLHFWIDCRNGTRIRLDEFEISEKKKILTQKEKSWTESAARMACRQMIKAHTLIPSEVDIHDFIGTSVNKSSITHNVGVTIDFDAKNVYGSEIPYTAKCYFSPNEQGTIEVNIRQ